MFEAVSLTVLGLILLADLLLVAKRPHAPSMKEASLWVALYVALALVFAVIIWQLFGFDRGMEFTAGWLTEYSLSIDNLFVFVIIMSRFAVPKKYQQMVLMVGIILALIFRGVFILLGAQLIESFSWIFFIFGAFLLYTAWAQAFNNDDEISEHADDVKDNFLVRLMKKRVNFTKEYHGTKLVTRVAGVKHFTPMLIVFIAIGSTDVMFALDSIPAIFGITQDPFIVFTANIFALMGLRQLYFLLGGLLERLVYLHYGIAAILAFIGIKLIFHALHVNELPFINGGQPVLWVPDITTTMSLAVIAGCLIIATIASLIKMRGVEVQDYTESEDTAIDLGDQDAADSGAEISQPEQSTAENTDGTNS
ncbi:MAG: TerC family protein [Microbacteriaceae bacterium]